MAVASEAGHWYSKDGKPAYETIGKDGLPRKTTLRDARKHGHGPGVSDIIKCASAEALENWKHDRLLETAASNPKLPGEDLEGYCKRVKAARREEAAKVPDLGTAIHGAIERHLQDKQFDLEFGEHVDGALAALSSWCGGLANIESERSFFHPLGFGGKVDIHKRTIPIVADFKSKAFERGEELKAWDNHA